MGVPEAALAECELLLELSDPMCVLDAQFRVTRVNAAQEQVSGMPRATSLGRTIWDVWPETALPSSRFGNEYRRCMQTRVGAEFTEYFHPLQKWLQVRVVPLEGQGLALLFRDVTGQREAEFHRALSEERLKLFVEHAPAAIALFDRDMRYLAHSRRYVADYGLSQRSLVGLKHYDVFPDLPERWKEVHRRALDEGEPFREEEDRFERADGSVRWLRWEVVPWLGADLQVGGLVLFTEDVTRFKQAQEALTVQLELTRRAEENLLHAQKMEAVGRLAGGVAHDFNNVLTVILAAADFIMTSLPDGHALRAEAEDIKTAGQRAADLTRQLLAFSRKQPARPTAVNLNLQLTGLEPLVRRLVGEDIELTFDLDPAVKTCHVDPGQFEQVVLNLVINARDAMPGGGRLRVETRALDVAAPGQEQFSEARCGPHVCVVVSDTGVGMPPEVQRRVFEPFFTTKPFGKGTGLGLAMVYGIVQQAGGTIGLSSEPGQGTTFRVSFPCAEPGAVSSAPRPSAPLIPSVRRSETVLLAEDEPQVRAAVSAMLRRAGYEVLEAGDGEEALSVLAGHTGPLHLLLTDVKMPRLGGTQLAARVSAQRPQTRVLFMSGYVGDEVESRGLPPGAQLLNKPFTQEELLTRIAAMSKGMSPPDAEPFEEGGRPR